MTAPRGSRTYVVGQIADPHGATTEALHAAWSDAEGNLFAVAGKFDRALTRMGPALETGTDELPTLH